MIITPHNSPLAQGDTVQFLSITKAHAKKQAKWLLRIWNDRIETAHDLLCLMGRLARERKWAPSTMMTNIGTVLGALPRAGILRVPCRLPWNIKEDQEVKEFLRIWRHKAFEHPVRFAKLVTRNEMARAAQDLYYDKNYQALVLLVLIWSTGARTACALRLSSENIAFTATGIKIRFVAGKGVYARKAPYTVHTTVGPWTVIVRRYLLRLRTPELFPESTWKSVGKAMLDAVKTHQPQAESRSLRRSVLSLLAQQGAEARTLLHYSGHTTESMLLRYLGWGWFHGEMNLKGTAASACLWC